MTNFEENKDPLVASFRELPTVAMPDGLVDKIMQPIEADMKEKQGSDMRAARSQRKTLRLQPYAAALVLIGLGLGLALLLHPMQQPNGNVTITPQTVAQNPEENAMPTDLTPGNRHVPQARIAPENSPTGNEEVQTGMETNTEELANLPQDESAMEGSSFNRTFGAHLNDIGADPMNSEESGDDPVMALIGF